MGAVIFFGILIVLIIGFVIYNSLGYGYWNTPEYKAKQAAKRQATLDSIAKSERLIQYHQLVVNFYNYCSNFYRLGGDRISRGYTIKDIEDGATFVRIQGGGVLIEAKKRLAHGDITQEDYDTRSKDIIDAIKRVESRRDSIILLMK